jgi:hypothetical protein
VPTEPTPLDVVSAGGPVAMDETVATDVPGRPLTSAF